MDKGFGKVFQYIGMLMPLVRTENPLTYEIALGGIELRQISDDFFISDDGNGFKSLKHLMETGDGRMVFESFTMDEIREGTAAFALKVLLIIAFALVAFAAIIGVIVYIVKSIAKKSIDKGKLKNLTVDITALIIAYLVQKLLLSDPIPDMGMSAAYAVMITVMCVIQLICGLMMLKRHSGHHVKRRMIPICFPLIKIFIIIFNVVYWQWYDFWSY